jgi:2-amino-4-hydroxy-6-hydroxymethyldihydropteridine diphosphokinase
MARVVLITGGNRGGTKEVERRLERAQEMVGMQIGGIVKASTLHRSEAWGFEVAGEDEGVFLNQVLVAETSLTPREVLAAAQQIEAALGRDRREEAAEKERTGQAYASRPIDIDILFYDNETIDEPDLQIPHPRIAERRFVLAPLHELGLCEV